MRTESLWRLYFRAVGWLLVWDLALTPVWMLVPPWIQAAGFIALVGLVAYCCATRFVRRAWWQVRHYKALRAPIIVDEDGNPRIEIRLPGEQVQTCLRVHPDGRKVVHHVHIVNTLTGRGRAMWPRQ